MTATEIIDAYCLENTMKLSGPKVFPNTHLDRNEADIFMATESGYLYEYEVKISRSDFFAEKRKTGKADKVDIFIFLKTLIMENKDIKTNPCPEFPFFGARYPDARCIDGYLWDLDSCSDDPNVFRRGGECPCPFCNTDKFIEDDPIGLVDCILSEMTGDAPTHGQRRIAIDSARRAYLTEIEILRESYGK